ncbi:MAG: hypothetical protein Q7R52_04390 [archaeon]|nr:hypothetical protein [archaeon]
MVLAAELLVDIQSFINTNGQIMRKRTFVRTINSGSMDDDILLTSGTDSWFSGCVQSVGQNENTLLQEGLLKRDDLKIYIDGSNSISGLWRLGLGGSPPTEEYGLISKGVIDSPSVAGSILYQKFFVRKLQNGSLFGE